MQKRILPIAITATIFISIFGWSCTKLDTTDVGSDQLPAVDNIHTFDTVLNIITSQGLFVDSTVVGKTDDHVLGVISNDPLFGTTKASIYMQLKPSFYPYYWGSAGDTISGTGLGLDSVVLCLNYKAFWGDSTVPVHLEVREINDFIFRDSIYTTRNINYQPSVSGTVIGSTDVDVRRMADTMHYTNGRDYSLNQIRIKLSPAFASTLFSRDSAGNHAFKSDSLYTVAYNGLAVIASGSGNGLIYTNLADTSTKLEVHFRRKNGGGIDSVYSSLKLNPSFVPSTTNPGSNTANNIIRNRAGFPVSSPAANELYLQTTPGTFANLSIPGLTTLSNRIVHRAELIIQQIPNNTYLDDALSAPAFLYVDLKDTGATNRYKPVYFDLSQSQAYDPDSKTGVGYLPTTIDYLIYGGFRRGGTDIFGTPNKYYNINITRYVQHIVTDHYPNYDLRLYAPYELYYPQFTTVDYVASPQVYGNNLAAGRVKIGGGGNTNYQMKLRIIYSKL